MKFDLLGKTEQIRRKVKAILFDRKNRKLSDKMYDKLGEFMEKLNEEGACVPEEYIEKVNSGLSELARLNNTRVEELLNSNVFLLIFINLLHLFEYYNIIKLLR